jgi:hypothetical protein
MIVQSEARKKCLGREREKRREGGGVKQATGCGAVVLTRTKTSAK